MVNIGVGVALGLQLALFAPPVQPCRASENVSWNKQSPIRMMSAHNAVTTPYERIRMSGASDADLAYPLVAAYLQRPELAHSVRELVYMFDTPARLAGLHDPGANRLPFIVSDSDHLAMQNHVDALEFPLETAQKMKESLDWWREMERSRHSQPSQDPEDVSTCITGARDREVEKTYGYYASTVTALMLSLCPNITTLYLGSVWSEPLQQYLLRSNYGLTPLPALQSLRHVEHCGENRMFLDMYDTVPLLDQFRYFHRLPQVRSVSMEGVVDYQVHRDIFPPKTSRSIKKIHIGHSDISDEMLATIIRIPTGLEEISVSLGGLLHPDGGGPSTDVGLLGRSLEQHKSTLRVLDIDLAKSIDARKFTSGYESDEDDDMDEEYDYREDLKDEYFHIDESSSEGPLLPKDVETPGHHDGKTMFFRDYTALKKLSIELEAIIGPMTRYYLDRYVDLRQGRTIVRQPPFRLVDALPPTLEYLCLYGYQSGEVPEVDEQVAELMEKKDERLPNLREIRGVDMVEHAIVLDEGDDDDGWAYWHRPEVELGWVEA